MSTDRVALITGAARGQGAAIVKRLHKDGFRVAACDLLVDDLAATIESVGGDVFEASLRALAFRGRLVVVGFAGGTIPSVKANYILLKNITLTGLQWALYPTKMANEVRRVQAEIFDLLARGKLDANIGATYGLSDIKTALGDMKNRRVRGKIVVRI